jgi:hypothetical protein
MKSFKGYLQERFQDWKSGSAPAWTESLSTMLFDLPRDGIVDIHIPLSPSIMSRIWPKSIRSKAFHLTDFDGVKKLKGMQKGRKSISAFYNMDDYMITSGIKTEGGYVVELEGDVLAASPDDISSQPDKSGRRWITVSSLLNGPFDADPGLGGKAKLRGIEEDIKALLTDIMAENDLGPYNQYMTTTEINKGWIYLGKSTGGKEKSLIIKDYIDGMENIMKKYAKPLRSILTDYTKKRTLEPDPDSGETAMWDELVVNNFTIQMIHIGPEMSPDFDPENEDSLGKEDLGGFDYLLYDDAGDMVDYINRKLI